MYTPYAQKLQPWQRWTSVVVRSQGDPLRLTASGKAQLRKLALAHRNELESSGPELAEALAVVLRHSRKAQAL